MCFGFWDVFLDSGTCFGFWEVFLDSGTCFWILGRVLDSGTCFWILGSVLDSGTCFVFWEVFCPYKPRYEHRVPSTHVHRNLVSGSRVDHFSHFVKRR